MNKKTKIQLSVIIFTMFFIYNFLIISTESISAKGILSDGPFYIEPHVEINYDHEIANDPLLPIDKIKEIPIFMNLSIKSFYAEEMIKYLEGSKLFADLGVVNYPEYCEATINPKKISLTLKEEGVTSQATLSLVINKTGHALSKGIVLIELDVQGGGSIVGKKFTKEIEFVPGYLPFLEFDTEYNTKKVSPNEIAIFEINVKNKGNAITNISFEILDKPKGWIIELPKNIELEDESNIILSARGPISFGHHDDRENITIKVVPYHYKNSSLKGKEYFLNFIVQSKGFSTPDFELLTFLFAIIIGVFILKIKKKNLEKKGK